ncbi:MAG: D-3-phosphoglycerate dehydrogenase [uncultured Thermomicrobiales bacterium]|uniref:D-3-phosphoglycerate dehydrogenase n=1 Tax=uncultured Thermomicrobiales bacterium TaxID=1645740 RepID=A0A6J4UL26_9BACT|nr:MAG: D-3-phosphoglycerate dehydrogenase [uncultured Thermomicrobiales bacterium]
MRVIVIGSYDEAGQGRFRSVAPDVELTFATDARSVAHLLGETDGVIGALPDDLLERASRLRWLHSPAAGVDKELTPAMRSRDIALTSSAGNGGIPLAEHAMLLMMMLNRSVPRWVAAQREHRWDRFTHGELNGQTVGIVGLGNAGADLALKAQAFHMRVLGMRRRNDLPVANVDRLFAPDDVATFLGACDFVAVTTPRTPRTAGMFDQAAFAAMKPTAFFVCISRGGIADDDALLDALRRGEIAGAGLDAHGTEPLPADSPFWDLPNVIVTPHNGATTAATARRGLDITIDNLGRFARGEPLRNVVDKTEGY